MRSGEDIKTALIVLGAKDESSGERVTISSVNGGKDYIFDEEAVNLFGWIWDTVEFDDVTLPENLLQKGKKYLSSVINESLTIELSAADLHYLDCSIEKFKKGDLVRVVSNPHKLDKYFLVSKLEIRLDKISESKLVLGQNFVTFTEKQNMENKNFKESAVSFKENNKKVEEQVKKLDEDVKGINNIITEIPGEYVNTKTFESYQKEISQKIASVYTVKGSVKDYESLLELKIKEIGDVYNVLTTGANYVWTDEGWDKLSETIDMSNYYSKEEIDRIVEELKGGTDVNG